MARTGSWWLKIKRAQEHMVQIDRLARLYAERHPYRVVPIRQPNTDSNAKHRLVITEHPDPRIAVVLGDFLFDVRSALDHIIVASVPPKERKNAGYPVRNVDPYAVNEQGQFIDPDDRTRDSFERQIRGLHPHARAFVIATQPYHVSDPERSIIGIISRLQNEDKHRKLTVIGHGIANAVHSVALRDSVFESEHRMAHHEFLEDGAIVEYGGIHRGDPEVEMQLRGTAIITVKVSRLGGNQRPIDYRLRTITTHSMAGVRGVLRVMEQFVLAT